MWLVSNDTHNRHHRQTVTKADTVGSIELSPLTLKRNQNIKQLLIIIPAIVPIY